MADFSDLFRARFEGQPLKGLELHFEGEGVRGEAVITKTGLEGGAIYALSAPLRDAIERDGEAMLTASICAPVSRRPSWSARLPSRAASNPSRTSCARRSSFRPPPWGCCKRPRTAPGAPLPAMAPAALAALIKAVPVRLTATASIERAISTAGGIAFDELDDHFMLRRMPGVFVAGEMLDWEAPTGGYLLQACFSTGAAAAKGAIEWLAAA